MAPSATTVTGDEANDEGRDGTGRYRDDQRFEREKHLRWFDHLRNQYFDRRSKNLIQRLILPDSNERIMKLSAGSQ